MLIKKSVLETLSNALDSSYENLEESALRKRTR